MRAENEVNSGRTLVILVALSIGKSWLYASICTKCSFATTATLSINERNESKTRRYVPFTIHSSHLHELLDKGSIGICRIFKVS